MALFKKFAESHQLTLGVEEELADLLKSKNFYPYGEQKPKSFDFTWTTYADIANNRLYLEMKFDDGRRFVGRINSGLIWPAMIDRFWGIDQGDTNFVGYLSDIMLDVYVEKQTLEQAYLNRDPKAA